MQKTNVHILSIYPNFLESGALYFSGTAQRFPGSSALTKYRSTHFYPASFLDIAAMWIAADEFVWRLHEYLIDGPRPEEKRAAEDIREALELIDAAWQQVPRDKLKNPDEGWHLSEWTIEGYEKHKAKVAGEGVEESEEVEDSSD